MFFLSATVKFGKIGGVKTKPPVLVITPGNVKRSTHPILKNFDGVPAKFYPSNQPYTLNLYTMGNSIDIQENETVYENSAISDMAEFINFLDSPEILGLCSKEDITIHLEGDIQDVSAFVNDVDVDYRAMCVLSVDFTQAVAGAYGIRPVIGNYKPNASGGGSQSLANAETGYFTQVEIENKEETNDEK